MSAPLFSVIVPVFNRAAGLQKTLDSVLSQDPALFECIVQDGGSTDGTVAVLESLGDRVRWASEPDAGVYDAMNRAMGRATGEFLYFLGAGDTLRPGILETVAAVLPRGPLTYFYGNVFSEAHGRVYNGRYGRWKISRINVCHQAVFCHRGLFERLGPFDTRYQIMADHVWNVKAFGDPRVRKTYSDLVIADYAAGGLSHYTPDPQLLADRLSLIRANLGPGVYAVNRLASLLPSGLKEARFRAFQKLREAVRRR